MKLTVTILLLPAALAWPSHNGNGQGLAHSHHGYEAYKSGHHHVSGTAFPSGSTRGPFGLSNGTASEVGSAIGSTGSTGSITSTAYSTVYNTVYETASELALSASPSEAAAGNPAGTCGGTTTVTFASTVTVTLPGKAAESAASGTPETQASVTPSSTAPEVVLPPTETSPVPKPVAPVSQTAVPTVEKLSTSSIEASSSTPAKAETTTSAAAQSATSSPPTVSAIPQAQSVSPPGGKRGLFIPESPSDGTQQDYVTAFNDNPGKISWIVNQFSGPPSGLSPKFNYVPQCYDKFSDVSYPDQAPHPWTTNAEKAIAAGEKYFLSFGEPNTNNTQNFYMDAPTGAQNFMTMLQPYATEHGISIGSPGTLGAPLDIQWQDDFLDACAGLGCKISWVSAHWFSPCGNATPQELADTFWGTINTYKSMAQKYSSRYGVDLKVWVDNFSLTCASDVQQEFFDIVVPQMDDDDMIARYGYVSITDVSMGNGFINTDGSISDLGLHYATM